MKHGNKNEDMPNNNELVNMKKHEDAQPDKIIKYEGATLDTPFLHIVMEPFLPYLRPLMSFLFTMRWQLSRPLQTRFLPSFFPFIDIPILRDLPYLTLGQVLLVSPLVLLFVFGYNVAFVSPNLDNSGYYTSYAVFAVFLTANKTNSMFAFLLGIPFERMIPYHNLASLLTVYLSCLHGYVAYAHGDSRRRRELMVHEGEQLASRHLSGEVTYAQFGQTPHLGKFLFDGLHNMSGSLTAITLMVLVATSFFPIFRRKFFDLWLWIHILSAVCVVIFATMHDVTSMLFIAAWWGVDVLTRYAVMATCRYPRQARLQILTDDVVQVSFDKPSNFQYNPGQFVQIAFRDIGSLQFHPISISSAPHEAEVTLHIKSCGGWSTQLLELARSKKDVPVLIEGPYGSLSLDIEAKRYEMVFLVAGGIGVTPCRSIAKSILHAAEQGQRKLKNLQFVWVVPDMDLPAAMGPPVIDNFQSLTKRGPTIGMGNEHQPDELKPVVNLSMYVTKSSNITSVQRNGVKTMQGRPDFFRMVADMKECALQGNVTHVAVFGCGPKTLLDDLKDACRQHGQNAPGCQGVTFDVHEEIFHF